MNNRYEDKIHKLVKIYPQLLKKPWFSRIIQNRIMVGDMNNQLVRLHIAHVKQMIEKALDV